MRVLIIEDDPAVSYFLTEVVTNLGHEAECASDGRRALEMFESKPADLILSDLVVPGYDGLEILEYIRKRSTDVIFVMITGHGSEELAVRALELRANNYLHKPIRYEALCALIEKYAEMIRTRHRRLEVRRMVTHRQTRLVFGNEIEMVAEVVNLLVEEAAPFVTESARFGIQLGLYELIVNAIEHGNLGITFQEKNHCLYDSSEKYAELLRERMQISQLGSRQVSVDFNYHEGKLEWFIEDDGEGFDWYALPNPLALENQGNLSGRGIFLARFQFDEMVFLGKGNRVRVAKRAKAF